LAPIAVAGAIAGGVMVAGSGLAPTRPKQSSLQTTSPQAGDDILDFAPGLRNARGCDHVQVSHTSNGREMFIAWFASRDALLEWFHGDLHDRLENTEFTDDQFDKLVSSVPDRSGPLLTVLTVTRVGRFRFEGPRPPRIELGIEYFRPESGQLTFGTPPSMMENHVKAIARPS
jgi:hypothetical protein